MKDKRATSKPPITLLRPLHSHQQSADEKFQPQLSGGQNRLENEVNIIHWFSSLEPRPEETTCLQAFVRLVSQIIILDPGESYCIQDSIRGGFILAQSPSTTQEEQEDDGAFEFIDCAGCNDIPTDFSIGSGKVSQSKESQWHIMQERKYCVTYC